MTPKQAQMELIKLCQENWERLTKFPHPYGMRHQFTGFPLNFGHFAWASTMYTDKLTIEALEMTKKILE